MKLYNSTSRQIEEFVPYSDSKVTMYTCGPTVYHFAHIGNLRTYIMEDMLEKSLEYLGYNVVRAMNITDVGHLSGDSDDGEDKMLIGAEREHKSVMDIAKEYTDAFKADFASLNLRWPKLVAPATSCIDEYIKIITVLLEKGYAYSSNGNIYFDTSKLKEYYRFGNQSKEEMMVGARDSVTEDEGKRNQNDFVLWFTKSKFENHALKWDSPWGVGYPGWHIECSGISYKFLGEHLDIHCGGVDNKFPHHTNEIAQTESYLGHPWCKYWFHVEHLNTKIGKMSKSNGDFLTLTRLSELGFSPMVYKLFCLQSHYRKQLVYSIEGLESAKSAHTKLIKRVSALNKQDKLVDNAKFEQFNQQFKQALSNDLNTSYALTTLYDVLKSDINDGTKFALVKSFDKVFGLDLEKEYVAPKQQEHDLDDETKQQVESMIAARALAKANKDYKTADEIRNKLAEMNIELIDTKEGTNYRLKV